MRPNSDAGYHRIDAILDQYAEHPRISVFSHLERPVYLSLLREVVIQIGNSSAGIIEAASFHVPVVDIGDRQHLRERGDNVLHVDVEPSQIYEAIRRCVSQPRQRFQNIYGDGQTASRVARYLKEVPLDSIVLQKSNQF